MDTNNRLRSGAFLAFIAAAAFGAVACSGGDDSAGTGGHATTSGGGGDDASAGSSGDGGSTDTGGSTGNPGGSTGTGGSTVNMKCILATTAGTNPGFLTDFSKRCTAAADASGPSVEACWTKWVDYQGTWAADPPAGKVTADNIGSDADPDAGCTMFAASGLTSSTVTNAWVISGTVGTYSSFGLWLSPPCLNVSKYTGLQLTISGDAGPTGKLAVQATEPSGMATAMIPVTSTATVVQIPWTDFLDANGTALDVLHVQQIQFQFDWSCLNNTAAYPVNITIDDLGFYQAG
jgi:hypothetical protein